MFYLCLFFFKATFLISEYSRPSHISENSWSQAAPYFLPQSHPIKMQLDEIFKKQRAVLSTKSMKKAGFIKTNPQKVTRVFVTRHKNIPGYIFKIYLDSQRAHKNKPEDFFWIKRIEGALAIASLLQEKNWESSFKVPKKWIYPLPAKPNPPSSFRRINYILVEEDMDLLSTEANKCKWGSQKIDEQLLIKLHTILETLGLRDCAKPDNIPFSKDGKIAFIDTQSHHEWPISYNKLSKYLTKSLQKKWKLITKNK